MNAKRSNRVVVLAYAGCSTCKRAMRWLEGHGFEVSVRPIVDEPPTVNELTEWIPKSEKPIRKWLNTSGQSYRALGKAAVDRASEKDLTAWLAKDGKLVKRPVVIVGGGERVLVGFDEAVYEDVFGPR